MHYTIFNKLVRAFSTSTTVKQITIPVSRIQRVGKNVSLIFDAKDTRQATEIVKAIESRNYVINTPSSSGSGMTQRASRVNKDVFLL